jgi:GNAT superfamily N-acetyltransferase
MMEGFEGPRPPALEELGNVVQFLNSQLRKESTWSIADEYPTAYSIENRENIRIIKAGDQVLSHAVVKTLIVKTPFGLFKVAAIGGVVTHESHRSQGYGRKILEDCVTVAQQQGHDFAILWTSLYDLYRKIGFELGGSEISVVLDKQVPVINPIALKYMKGANVSPEALERVYSKHTVTNIRRISDIQKFLRIPNSTIYTAWTNENQLVAYAVEGKGADLNGYIHEWGGGVNEILHLLNFAIKDQKRNLTVICPGHSANLIKAIQPHAKVFHPGFLGMIKILNKKNLTEKVNRYARLIGHSRFDLAPFIDQCPEQQLVKVFFGPSDSEFLSKCDDKNREIINQILPIPMWVWGWDSV